MSSPGGDLGFGHYVLGGSLSGTSPESHYVRTFGIVKFILSSLFYLLCFSTLWRSKMTKLWGWYLSRSIRIDEKNRSGVSKVENMDPKLSET